MSGKLTKLVIEAYKDSKFKTMAGSKEESTFTVQVNPEKYSQTITTQGDDTEKLANGQSQDKSKIPDTGTLDLNFFLDATGVIAGCDDVPDAIKKFEKVCSVVNGAIHTTNYLKVYWGKGLAFPCKLHSVTIDYLMFNPGGIPIRAELKAKFKKFIDPETKASETNTNSPDMSHVKTIKAGDTLPALCHEIYGDPKYYLQVAEINDILDFRNLIPGQRVHFPRMEK